MTNTKALIISGGDVDYNFQPENCRIIAVDGGLEATKKMGLVPDIIIGDFDTVSPEILKEYEDMENCRIIRLCPEKDDTDTESAINLAIREGFREIDVLGATGSRFDHTYANMFLLKKAYLQNVTLTFYTGLSKIYLISGKKEYHPENFFGTYISFLQFDGNALGVTLSGFKYPLDNFDFDTTKTWRLGVSNEPVGTDAFVEVKSGCLLVVESLEDKKR